MKIIDAPAHMVGKVVTVESSDFVYRGHVTHFSVEITDFILDTDGVYMYPVGPLKFEMTIVVGATQIRLENLDRNVEITIE